jgi:hypothetical protein
MEEENQVEDRKEVESLTKEEEILAESSSSKEESKEKKDESAARYLYPLPPKMKAIPFTAAVQV